MKIGRLIRWLLRPQRWTRAPIERWHAKKTKVIPTGLGNSSARDAWVCAQLKAIPAGWRLLDAGAGEQRYRKHCAHLTYVSQDHEAYDGCGDGVGGPMGKRTLYLISLRFRCVMQASTRFSARRFWNMFLIQFKF